MKKWGNVGTLALEGEIVIIALKRYGLVGLLLVSVLFSTVVAQEEETDAVGTFGFGLETTGSVCCISVRFWLEDDRGSEMVLNAYDTHLFITLRGLQAVGYIEPITAYTGMGLTLRFGEMVSRSPFSVFMAMQGFIAVEGPVPFYELLTGNIEASVELRPPFGFSASLGLGVHFYF